jgi:hypothetical protein
MTTFPAQLTTLKLNRVEFNSQTLPSSEPRFLPHLIDLTLINSVFLGRLQDYLDCPNLKSLCLERLRRPCEKTGELITSYTIPVCSFVQFRSLARLERLSIRTMTVDEEVTTDLQLHPLLQHLDLDHYSAETLVSLFIASIADEANFVSLKRLSILPSFWMESNLPEEFVRTCAIMRPGLIVSIVD